jgi:antitoxin component YwqK of YwqJK toxin-antitoxin module
MKTTFLPLIALTLFLTSCSNEVEEIKNPSTGKLLKRYEYYTDDSGQKIKDGEYVEWDAAGKKIAELHYQADSLHGSCVFYAENGQIHTNNYNNGRLDGQQEIKLPNGVILSRENFSNGVLDGKQQYFSVNGKKLRESYFISGKPTGKWIYYLEDSKDSFQLRFKNEVCQEFIGTWDVEGERQTSMIFGKNGSFQLWAPYYDNFGDAALRVDGEYKVDGFLHAMHKNGISLDYEIFHVSKDTIILLNAPGEKVAITELIRKQ